MAAIPDKTEIRLTIKNIVKRLLPSLNHNYEDIIDLVFIEIENNYMDQYESWIALPGNAQNTNPVNAYIGRLIEKEVGLVAIEYPVKPRSKLIKAYSKLGRIKL